jgi:hypothetical protein
MWVVMRTSYFRLRDETGKSSARATLRRPAGSLLEIVQLLQRFSLRISK